ncbi:hypothetical protein HYH02_007812 [Chlamydomonas schloesseri]|uniref:Protein kinase domain-containing protein n=1 Tax=Chlamydomonas schloesseri TaxID=2026947 RepID=A0A835WH46_9CHLO|nr:hypothetical protein HYH02_007812 [Chlamydomonas schloesseri]|eukprot:KAG2447061.1 hypothetical protein HYH02_007812 [Chlamydomonas schloesseri]
MARLRQIAAVTVTSLTVSRQPLRLAWPLLVLLLLGLLLGTNCCTAHARRLAELPVGAADLEGGASSSRGLLQTEDTASSADAAAAAAAAGYSSAGAVLVSTAAQLVAAIADPAVRVAVLSGSVALTEADWAPVAQPVVEVRRNLTLLGAYTAPAAWPTLNLGYTANLDGVGIVKSAKLRVAPGCTLTFRHLVLTDGREVPQFLFMGLDVFAQSPAPDSTLASSWPLVFVHDAALWQRTCLPLSVKALPSRGIPRPAFLPGVQNSTGASVPRPPDCVDDDATAPPMMRCWPARGLYRNMAVYAYDADAYDRQTPAGYAMHLVNATFWCDILMTDECVASNGGYIACYYSLFPYSRKASSSSSPSPAANMNLTAAGGGGNVGASAFVAGAQPAGGGGGGGGAGGSSSDEFTLAPVLCGVLAGLVGLALGAGLVWAFVSYRRRRTKQREKDGGSDSAASTPHVQQLLLVDTAAAGGTTPLPPPADSAAAGTDTAGCISSQGLPVFPLTANNRCGAAAGASGKLAASKSTTDSDALSMLMSGTCVMGSHHMDTSGRAGGMSPGTLGVGSGVAEPRAGEQVDTTSSIGMRTAGAIEPTDEDERALVPVTPLTPFQSHIPLDVKLGSGGGEVRLLPITLGKAVGDSTAPQPVHARALTVAGSEAKAPAPGPAEEALLALAAAEIPAAVAPWWLGSASFDEAVKEAGAAAAGTQPARAADGDTGGRPDQAAAAPMQTAVIDDQVLPAGREQQQQQQQQVSQAGEQAQAAARPLLLATIRMGGPSVLDPACPSGDLSNNGGRPPGQQQLLQCLCRPQLLGTSSESLMSVSIIADGKNESAGRPAVAPGSSTRYNQSLPPPAEPGEAALAPTSTIQDMGRPPGGVTSEAAVTGGVQDAIASVVPDASTLDSASKAAAARIQAAARRRQPLTHGGAARRTMAQEVEVLARLQHPNIVQLLAANLNPACPCLVVELMDTSLDKLLHGCGGGGGRGAVTSSQPALLPLNTVLHIALQVARALSYLHPTIIHRDLKPGNVLISDPGSATPLVKIADFGLSRLQDTVLITAHVDVGTAPYMAPEALDARNCIITHHSDMYSYGIMLYEMLAGARPWRGLNMLQIARAVCERQARPRLEDLSEARCPQALRALVSQCWDPVPERRPSAAEVAKQLAIMVAQR